MNHPFTSIDSIREAGFHGGLSVRELQSTRCAAIPTLPGVYLIVRKDGSAPSFLVTSVGGHFKGKNPTVPVAELQAKWVTGTPVVYIGKAGGDASRATLKSRLWQYMQFGMGKDIGHWGGRYIWQLADHADLIVWWKPTERDAETVESELLEAFVGGYGKLPFANVKGGKRGESGKRVKGDDESPQFISSERTVIPKSTTMDSKTKAINDHLLSELRRRGLASVTAVEAAIWLDRAGLLKDSVDRPGKPLRDLLRAGKILGAVQGSDRKWEIRVFGNKN